MDTSLKIDLGDQKVNKKELEKSIQEKQKALKDQKIIYKNEN